MASSGAGTITPIVGTQAMVAVPIPQLRPVARTLSRARAIRAGVELRTISLPASRAVLLQRVVAERCTKLQPTCRPKVAGLSATSRAPILRVTAQHSAKPSFLTMASSGAGTITPIVGTQAMVAVPIPQLRPVARTLSRARAIRAGVELRTISLPASRTNGPLAIAPLGVFISAKVVC